MIKLFFIIVFLHAFNLFSQNIDYAKSIVNTLASEKYKGRGYCGKADMKSAEFIRNEFNNMGIVPLGNKYYQFFDLNVNSFPGKMEVKINDNYLRPGINYLIDPTSPSLKGKFDVVRLGRPELLKLENNQKLIRLYAGKALLIDMIDSIIYSKEENEKINKLIEAIKYDPSFKNPLTLIFSDKKLTWSISDKQMTRPVITINSFELNSLGISKIEVNITAKFKKNYKTRNVIGMIHGSTSPDSFLLITAHYDHLGIMGKETCFPGANDNASGIAMLLDMARYFSTNPPKYSIVFIAFSAEEAGLLGSIYFVQNPLFDLSKIRFMINFDLAGTGDEGIKVVNASVFKSEFEKLQEINNKYNFLNSVQERGEACNSDHCVFYLKKIPCFYIYTLGGIKAYHDIYDKAETLPFTAFFNYRQLMIAFLSSL
jgi:aminopeptidase YwaD